jgi:hydroxyacylglutathione hydrolase
MEAEEAQHALARIGLDNVAGFLRNGMRGWIEAAFSFEQLGQMSVHELKRRADAVAAGDDNLQILDVRRRDEWQSGIVPGAHHIFAPHIRENLDRLDRTRPVAVYCGSGYRASIAASVLQREGFREVYNVPGSMSAWKAARYETIKPGSVKAG